MTTCRAAILLLAAAALALPAGRVGAQTPKEQATALVKQGSAAYERGDYTTALERFERANKLFPSYKIVFNIATTLEYMGRAAEAAQHYARFLRLGGPAASIEMIKGARAAMAKLEPGLGRLILACAELGATLRVGGVTRGTTPLTAPLYLAPGQHELRLEKPGFTTLLREVTIRARQERRLELRLERLPPASAPSPPPSPTSAPAVTHRPAPTTTTATAPPTAMDRSPHTQTIWGYTTLGLGVALTAAAAVLYGVGGSEGAEAHDRYNEVTSQPGRALSVIDAHRAEVEAAREKILAGNILISAGVVALGASLYLLLTRPRPPKAAPAPAPVAVGLVPGGARVTLGGVF